MNIGHTRRDFVGCAAGLGLSFVLPGMDLRAAEERGAERQKSLILLWLDGGPSQLETWDPHPGGPVGGSTRAIATSIPGIEIAADFPRLAEQLQHLSVVRSLVSKEGDHARGAYAVKTGYRPDPVLRHPALGAIITHELPNSEVEIPQFIALGPNPWPSRGGYLGGRFDAFHVYDPATRTRPGAQADRRLKRRIENLNVLSQSFARGRQQAIDETLHDEHLQTVLKMLDSEQLQAFQIDTEPAALRAAYGDSDFGRACLVARRLIETGVRVVEVTLSGFDTHRDNFTQVRNLAAKLDPAFATLVADLVARDLLASTVVLCLGEFGRTPKVNRYDGRDHWPTGFSCLVGGGGLRGGVAIGSTDPAGEHTEPEDPARVADLYATILEAMHIDPAHQVTTPIGRPMKYSAGTPIERLLGRTNS